MGKASISIAISGSYNGTALEKATKALERMSVKAAAAQGSMGKSAVETGAKWAQAGGALYKTGERVEATGDKITKVTSVMAGAAVGVALASGAAAIDIDTALTGVRKTVDGTDEQYQQLKKSAIEFSKTNAVSASQILDIQALGAQLGFSIDELDEFSRVVSGMDIATDMDAETAATQLAQFANITRMAHGDVSRYGSAIVNLGNNMATTESAISNTAQRIAAASSQVGMSQADILGWSAAMSSLGVEAEAGGTAFSQTVSTIDKAVATGSDDLNAFAKIAGMSSSQFKDSWKSSASETMIALLQGTDSAENMSVALEQMGVTGVRQTDVLKRLAGNTDLVSQALQVSNDGWRENTALQSEVDNRNDSMAAKLEILKNKLIAIGEQIGTPLVNALTDAIDAAAPFIQGIENAATAFSDMGRESQMNVIALGALVAAFGPVTSIGGKVMKVAGGIVTGFGKAAQQTGVFADAMTTTNPKTLELYSSNEKLNGALKRNPAVQAAGGVSQYVGAVSNANKATSDYHGAVRKLSDEQKKGSKANGELIENLKAEVVQKHATMTETQSLVTGYKQSATAATASSASIKLSALGMEAFAVATNVAKAALATFAPMLILTGITWLIDKFKEAKEHSDNYKAATEGLTSATKEGSSAAQAGGDALEAFGKSATVAKPDIDGLLKSQAQLAQTIHETNSTASAQMAQLQTAYGILQQYANHSDLSTEAQGKLKVAVDTVNNLCGTQISVTDAANGKLADEKGAIEDVAGSLGGYIDKKMEQIRIDAQQQNLSGLYKQQQTDIEKVAQATQNLNKEMEGHDAYIENYLRNSSGYYQNSEQAAKKAEEGWQRTHPQAEQAKTDLEEAKGALSSVNTSIENTQTALGAQASAADGSSVSLRNMVMANQTVSGSLQGLGFDLNDFTNDLSNTGISVEQFKSLNDDQLVQLAASWKGTSESLVTTLDGMGVQMSDKGVAATNALSSALSGGAVNVEAATNILKAAAAGDWSSVNEQMKASGVTLPDSVATGITEEGYAPSAATETMLSELALKLTGGDIEAAATLLGHDIDAGLADGIKNGTLSESEAKSLGDDVIAKAKESLDSNSPSKKFIQIGSDVDEGMANGINGNSSSPLGAIGGLIGQILGQASNLPGDLTNKGSESSSGLATGIGSGIGSVFEKAYSIAQSAAQGVAGTPGSLSSTGTVAGADFAAGVGSAQGATSGSGWSLSAALNNAISGAPGSASNYGSAAGSYFASGVGNARATTSGNAQSLSSALNSALSVTPGQASRYGSSAGSNFSSSIGSHYGSVSGSASSLANAAQSMNNNSGSAHTWGSHLAQNFASGISAGIGWVASAAQGIAARAKSILGFSVPAAGPWSGSEKGGMTSGLHLAQNFAAGMMQGSSNVEQAAAHIAAAAAPGSYGSHDQSYDSGQSYDRGQQTVDLQEVINLLRVIASKDGSVYMDTEKVSAEMYRQSRTTAMGRGYAI